MGFFSHSQKPNTWPGQQLTSEDQLQTILTNSFTIPQLIFKHSTRCSISRYVLHDFISSYSFSVHDFGTWYLDLLAYRTISNAIAVQLDVVHQSPQLLVVKNGKVIAHASHEAVNGLRLSEFL